MKSSPRRILILERDRELSESVRQERLRVGIDAGAIRSVEADAFSMELRDFDPELVVVDHAASAGDDSLLGVLAEQASRLPIIFVASTFEEEVVVEVMRAGAADFLSSGRLHQLGVAVERAIRAADLKRKAKDGKQAGVRCELAVEEPLPELPANVGSELFYICQEALTNIARHAGAQSIEIKLHSDNGAVLLEVLDDGVGIEESKLDQLTSLGLLGMRERALKRGGAVRVRALDPSGTGVFAKIPLTSGAANGGRQDD